MAPSDYDIVKQVVTPFELLVAAAHLGPQEVLFFTVLKEDTAGFPHVAYSRVIGSCGMDFEWVQKITRGAVRIKMWSTSKHWSTALAHCERCGVTANLHGLQD